MCLVEGGVGVAIVGGGGAAGGGACAGAGAREGGRGGEEGEEGVEEGGHAGGIGRSGAVWLGLCGTEGGCLLRGRIGAGPLGISLFVDCWDWMIGFPISQKERCRALRDSAHVVFGDG